MFEYLMPMLLMPSVGGTNCWTAVAASPCGSKSATPGKRRVPWGISESCCGLTDASGVYCYRAFGVPELGLMRGLRDRLVVAPYASALAAMIAPAKAWRNLSRLERLGHLSPWGFYDAVDYTAARRQPPEQHGHEGARALQFLYRADPMPNRHGPSQRHDAPGPSQRIAWRADAAAVPQIPLHAAHDLLLQERHAQAIRPVDLAEGASCCSTPATVRRTPALTVAVAAGHTSPKRKRRTAAAAGIGVLPSASPGGLRADSPVCVRK